MYYRVYRNGEYLKATRFLSMTDYAATPGDTYTVRAVDAYETESADSAVATPVLAGLTDYIINAGFDGSEEGFVYSDDVFRGTNEPFYADPLVRRHGGDPDGNLMVVLGGIDQDDIFGMSGAWETSFNLAAPATVQISFDYRLYVTPDNDGGEYGEALFAVDGNLYSLASIASGGDTGWVPFATMLNLGAGDHTISFGGYQNQKTTKTEWVEISFDEVRVAPTAPAVGITDPAEGSVLAGLVDMELRATDIGTPSNQLTVEVSTDDGDNWTTAVWDAATQRFDFTIDASALSDGPIDLMARASDTNGNTTTVTTPFVIDNDGDPTVAITDPPDGANVTGVVTVKVDASDPEDPAGSLFVEVSTDGATWDAAAWNAGTGLYEFSWDTAANGDGPATIEARATDSAPATVYADPVNVNVITTPGTDYGDTVIGDGATVFWRLGEASGTTAVDSVGDNDATYVGSPTLGATAVIASADTAVGFDGIDDRINIANSPEINQGGPYQTKTIELWFRADNVTNRQVLLEQGSVTRGLNIYLDGGRLYAGAYNTNNQGGNTPWGPVWVSTPVTASTIYHAVMVFDQPSDTLSLYLNGSLAASAGGIGDLNNHSLSAIGGQRGWARYHTGAQNGDINNFDGTIDEVAVYATALSGGTIATHYAVGTSTSTEPAISIVSPSEGESVSGVVTVVLNATDPDDPVGTLDVEVRTQAGGWNSATWNGALSRYEYSWDTSVNGDGPATVEARVTDMTPTTVTATPVNVTVFTPPATDYRQTVLNDGANVYWRLDESSGTTAVDATGGNDATYVGGPALGAAGIITGTNASVDFDGVDDRVNIVNAPEVNQGGPYTTKTIELWFNADSVSGRQVLLEQGSISRGLNIYVGGGKLRAGMYNTNDQGGDTPWGPLWLETDISAGTDYHVVLVMDKPSGTLSLYVNGALADSATGVGDLYNHGLSAIGGQRGWARYHTGAQNGDMNYFSGRIDEVAMYPSALTATQVAAHYAAGTS